MRGIALRLTAMVALALMFATSKIAAERGVHLVETLFYRQFFSFPLLILWIWRSSGFGILRTRRLSAHMSRTVVGMIGMALNFGSFILLPLAEATAIGFMVPIFGTILSALVLREPTGVHRWTAVLLGFVGVLIVIPPIGSHLPALGLAVGLGGAVVTAIVALMLRSLGRHESATATVFYYSILPLPPLAMALFFFGQDHPPAVWLMLAAVGSFGCIAQLCMTASLRYAPVSLVLPMDYSTLIWASLIGWHLYGQWPGASTLGGAALIIFSGLYIVWRERRLALAAKKSGEGYSVT